MKTPISFGRLLVAMFAAGVIAAISLSAALQMASATGQNPDSLSLLSLLGMSVFFCFFTVPVAAVFALPAGWLWQRFGPIPLWLCVLLGAVCGCVGAYGTLLLTFVPTFNVSAASWFAIGGAAAGLAVGFIMGRQRPTETPPPSAANTSNKV
jgi:MFS family permease